MDLAGRNAFNNRFFKSDPLSTATWRNLCSKGKLPGARQIGGQWRVDLDHFQAQVGSPSADPADTVMAEALAIIGQIA